MALGKADKDFVLHCWRRSFLGDDDPVEDAFSILRFSGEDVKVQIADIAPQQGRCLADALFETVKDAIFLGTGL